MKVNKIVSFSEFQPMKDGSEHYMYFYFDDGSKVRIDSYTQYTAEFHEKFDDDREEYETMIIGLHRWLEAFTPEIAREYSKRKPHYYQGE